MAATETAFPYTSSPIASVQQYRDRYRWSIPDGIDADIANTTGAGTGEVTDGGSGASVNIANVSAIIQGFRYELTGGPLNLPVSPNGGASNRYDIVCLTFDPAHTPVIYARIVEGAPGGGLPTLTHSSTGVWDFPLAQYVKTPAGAITLLTDRRRYLDSHSGDVLTPANTSPYNIWPVTAVRSGARMRVVNSSANVKQWRYQNSTWMADRAVLSTGSASSFTGATVIGTFPSAIPANAQIGHSIKCRVYGNVSHSGTVTFTFQWRLDSTSGNNICDFTSLGYSTAVAGDRDYWIDLDLTVNSTGASGGGRAHSTIYDHIAGTGPAGEKTVVQNPVIDTTVGHDIVLVATCSVSSASNVARTLAGHMERIV